MDSTNTLAPTAITDDSDAAKRWLHQTQFMLSALPSNCVPADTGREIGFCWPLKCWQSPLALMH